MYLFYVFIYIYRENILFAAKGGKIKLCMFIFKIVFIIFTKNDFQLIVALLESQNKRIKRHIVSINCKKEGKMIRNSTIKKNTNNKNK